MSISLAAIMMALVVCSAFLVATLAFLPSKQFSLRPVRVRRDNARRMNRR